MIFISYLLVIAATLIVMAAQVKVNSAYSKYRKVPSDANLTGAEVAESILREHGLTVSVTRISGTLTDHYDPRSHTLRLSDDIYSGTSIASLAVAAHECGHAIQHAENYAPLKWRTNILPLANGGNYLGWIAIMIGLLSQNFKIAMVGFALLGFMLAFQLVTLPVEFDASSRALVILRNGYLDENETGMARQMLNAAALTYVASVASTVLNLLRVFLVIFSSTDHD